MVPSSGHLGSLLKVSASRGASCALLMLSSDCGQMASLSLPKTERRKTFERKETSKGAFTSGTSEIWSSDLSSTALWAFTPHFPHP